jgi:hypothetical protein
MSRGLHAEVIETLESSHCHSTILRVVFREESDLRMPAILWKPLRQI